MSRESYEKLPNDLAVPDVRDRLGLAHQLRVDVSIVISMLPAWVRRMLGDRDPMRSRAAKAEIAERISASLERRFRITWHGSDDQSENAQPQEGAPPLWGGPVEALRGGESCSETGSDR